MSRKSVLSRRKFLGSAAALGASSVIGESEVAAQAPPPPTFDFLFPVDLFGAQTLRLVAQAQKGGGDLFDIARTCRSIKPGDKDGWERGWRDLAIATEAKAKDALAKNHKRTAMQYFFQANQYYRMTDVFLTGWNNPKKAEAFRKLQENFRAGAKLHDATIEVIKVRSGKDEYDGYFCHPTRPRTGRWPAVFFIGGADSFAEEIYFAGTEILERGWALLMVDTPGRGSAVYLNGITTRPDYEVPGKACIDYLVTRREIDPNRIAIMGISMGGYYAPRVAAFEKRVKALVSWSGSYNLLDDLYDFCPDLQATCQFLLGGVGHEEARGRMKEFSMAGIARNITCPTIVTHGGADRLMRVEGAKQMFAELGAKDKTLRIYDQSDPGGRIHCSHDYWAHNLPYMLDWLEERI